MSLVGRNIAANLIGGLLLAAMTLVLTPLQIKILGMEAYGIVGFVATLQLAFTVFDFGLSSTLTRELAADVSPGRVHARALVSTATSVYWASAIVLGTALVVLAGPVARHWFNAAELSEAELEASLQVVALFLALRWPVALYSGMLAGLQRLDALNAVKVTTAAVRLLGGIGVLLATGNLRDFLMWTAASALVEVLAFAATCRRIAPDISLAPGFSVSALLRVWRFSASMNALAILAVVIVQLDRLVVSKMLLLEELGHYNLAYSVASLVSLIVGAVNSAVMPSLAAAQGIGGNLTDRYDAANRILLFMAGMAAFALIFFGGLLVSLWVDRAAAAATAVPIALLAVGFWFSAVVANSYNVAVACGRPRRFLVVNVASVLPYAVALYQLVERYGIAGAGVAWIVLNVGYVTLLTPAVHRSMLGVRTTEWLIRTVVPFAVLGLLSFGIPAWIVAAVGRSASEMIGLAALVTGGLIYTAAGWRLLGARQAFSTIRRRASGEPESAALSKRFGFSYGRGR